jgi:GYF domain 2
MAESWTISVGGRVYGPYSLEQMQDFHAEKRLADHSLVARGGEEQFHPASEDPELATWFQPIAREAASASSETAPRFGSRAEGENGVPSHFVIIADMKSRSITSLEDEIFALGAAHRFGAQAWALSSEISLNTIRNALVQKLGKIDTLFIVDATRDKAAWFNFGPETDTRIRRMWSRPAEHQGVEKRTVKRT